MEENRKNISGLCNASLEISKCINDNEFLIEKLNNIDINYLYDYRLLDKSGPIIELRKEIAKLILLSELNTEDVLLNTIEKYKLKYKKQLNSWKNPYRFLHPFINMEYDQFNIFIKDIIIDNIITDNLNYKICNFNGSQNQGSDEYWVAFYENDKNESQIFISFKNGKVKYGSTKLQEITNSIEKDPQDFSLDEFILYFNDNKDFLLEKDKKVYCVRAGEANIDSNLFLENDYVGIDYNSDIRETIEMIRYNLEKRGLNKNQINARISQIEIFKKIEIGDIILCPSKDDIKVGIANSKYYYREGKYPNAIDVRWVKNIQKDKSINLPKTVFEVGGFDFKSMDLLKQELTFVDVAKIVLKENNNIQMTSSEIWNRIKELDLYRSSGLTPDVSLNAILRRNSKNCNVKNKSTKPIFLTTEGSPNRFRLISFVPEHIKESFIEEGFVTIDKYDELRSELDKIKEILIKNNINLDF
jgi:hypothetical protein